MCWDVLEPYVRNHPEYWLWSYKHWRFKPKDNGERYPFYANEATRFDKKLRIHNAATAAAAATL